MKVLYAMQKELLDKYMQIKDDILLARSDMSVEQVEVAKTEILKECKINDFDAESSDLEPKDLYVIEGNVAKIDVSGMLVQKVDVCAALFSNESITTYRYIREAVIAAENDFYVDKIALMIDSGGGNLSGLDITFQTLLSLEKPTIAIVKDSACSAAYWLASACDEIAVVSNAGFLGSIGVAVELIDRSGEDKAAGIRRRSLTNRESMDKRPDLTTDDGMEILADELDSVYNVFVDSILITRESKLTREAINDLSGKSLIASEAVKYGLADRMIGVSEIDLFLSTGSSASDKIGSAPLAGDQQTDRNKKTEDSEDMELKEIFKKYPEAKAEHDNIVKSAEKTAVEKDRDRFAKVLALQGNKISAEDLENAKVQDVATFAEAELERRNQKLSAKDSGENKIDPLLTGDQVPKKPKEDQTEEVGLQKFDNVLDKYLGRKKEPVK